MRNLLVRFVLAAALAAPLAGQQAAGPQPKSQKELDQLLAIQNAPDPQTRIDASQKLLTDFVDTDFKEFANFNIMLAYQQLNDFENMLIFGERTLQLNPDNVGALLQLAYAIPTRTREFDLDKEEKLSRAEDYGKRALTLVPNMEKPNPQIADDEWLLSKKDFMAQAHEALGQIELKRENFPQAEEHFREALNVTPQQNSSTFYHLANALEKQGKKDEALTTVNKSIELATAEGAGSSHVLNAANELKAKLEQGS